MWGVCGDRALMKSCSVTTRTRARVVYVGGERSCAPPCTQSCESAVYSDAVTLIGEVR